MGATQSRETANLIKATNLGNLKGGSGEGGVDGVVDQEGGAGSSGEGGGGVTHSDKPQFSGWGALVDVG